MRNFKGLGISVRPFLATCARDCPADSIEGEAHRGCCRYFWYGIGRETTVLVEGRGERTGAFRSFSRVF